MLKFRITQDHHGQCSVCRRYSMRRIHRSQWMKRLPGTKLIQCHHCHAVEYVFFDHFSIIRS